MRAFVVGFPKSGTSTLDRALNESGLKSAHWKFGDQYVGEVIYRNIFNGLDPFAGPLAQFDAITQADVCLPAENKNFWPQLDISILQTIVKAHPECTYILNWREPAQTVNSIRRWYDMHDRFKNADIPGLPGGFGNSDADMVRWIEAHFSTIRSMFQGAANFVEYDIEDPHADKIVGQALGIDFKWWGVANANLRQKAAPVETHVSDTAERLAILYSTLVPEDINVPSLTEIIVRQNLTSPEEVHVFLANSPRAYSRVLEWS